MMEKSAISIFIFMMNIIMVYGDGDVTDGNDLPVVCPQCDPNWTPFPNMVSGLVGYNIVRGDPLKTDADPGMGNQIFAPTKYIDGTVFLDESITAYELSNCQRSMSVTTWTTMTQMSSALEQTSTSGMDLQLGYESTVTVGVEGLDLSSDIPAPFTMAWSNSQTMLNAASSFSETQGMVSFSSGICVQYEMKLSSYSLPEFMPPFVIALGELHDATSKSASEQDGAFRKFVEEFGTHYMIHSELGAIFAQKTTYSGIVRENMNHEALQQCTAKKGMKLFGIQLGPDTSKCTDQTEESLNSYSQSDVKQVTITKGSRPTDIEEWVTQDFTPTPLKYTFSPIVNIFQENFIEKRQIKNEAGELVDSLKLRQWFMPIYDKYCEVLGFECSMGSGCGFDDKCPPSSICEGTGTTHECEEWSSWSCYQCGAAPQERRTRTCTGCRGGAEEIRDAQKPDDCCNVKYKLSVQVSLYETGDKGDEYEPYGNMEISIGQRKENQKIKAWNVARDAGLSQVCKEWYKGPVNIIDFYEDFDFLTAEKKFSFTLHGDAYEADGNPDDLLANFEGFNDDVHNYLDFNSIHFNGEASGEEGSVNMKFYKP